MNHKSQKQRVIAKLNRDGFITRNECLSQFPAITRLGAIIQDLEDEGYEFKVNDWRKEKDCIYTWTNRTKTVIVEKPNGERVAQQILIK